MGQRNPDGRSDDELLTDWAAWIERTASELSLAYNSRYTMRTVQMMFDENPKLHTESRSYVFRWLATLYARDVLMYIRREFDVQDGIINLLQLPYEIAKRPTIVSRWRFRKHYDTWTAATEVKEEIAKYDFDGMASSLVPRFGK